MYAYVCIMTGVLGPFRILIFNSDPAVGSTCQAQKLWNELGTEIAARRGEIDSAGSN